MQEHKPLYLYSREEALRHGERDQWRNSYRENCDCARAIERAIAENYRDNCLGNCAGSILDRYGFTRVNWVLANTIQQKSYYFIRIVTILYSTEKICYTPLKTVLEDADMPRYVVTLTNDEIQELKALIQKGGKGYRIKHAQILLKLDQKPENKAWTYDRIIDAYGASRSTIAGIAQRFVMEGMEAALGRKVQENRRRKVTGDVEARICAIACSEPPEGASRWTMQAIADELIRLEVVDYITDSTICEVMKKTKSSRGL